MAEISTYTQHHYLEYILRNISGLHFTLHNEAKDDDVYELKLMSRLIKNHPLISSRLAIYSRLYDRYDFSNIDLTGWHVGGMSTTSRRRITYLQAIWF